MKQFVDSVDVDLKPEKPRDGALKRGILDVFCNIVFGLIWVLSLILLVLEIS